MTDHLIFERNVAREESSDRGGQILKLNEDLQQTTIERNVARDQADRQQAELQRMHTSMSWKMTKPVREFRHTVGRLIRPRR